MPLGPPAGNLATQFCCSSLILLVRCDRDREVSFPERSVADDRTLIPVRVYEPRLGARPGALGFDWLAVHARRVRRRDRNDHLNGANVTPFYLQERGGTWSGTRRTRPSWA